MSYKVTIDEKGISFPRFYCDVCRKPIEKLDDGNTIFSEAIPGNTAHTHKLCDAALGKGAGYNRWHSLEIDLVYLLRRYGWVTAKGGMTPEFRRAIERAEAFSGL